MDFLFWQRWLFVSCLITAVSGIGLAVAAFMPYSLEANAPMNAAFWELRSPDADARLFQRWIYGVLGASIIGWATTLALLARYPFKDRQVWARNAVAAGMLIWFPIDSAISLYFGVLFNVAVNAILFVAVMLPVVITWRSFGQQERAVH